MKRGILRFAGAVLLLVSNAFAATHYVDVNSSNPTPPYSDLSTAAIDIQSAIDAASDGDVILVNDGTYQTGGSVYNNSLTNRVVVNKAIMVQSVNGPDATVIQGNPEIGTNAVRCVYLGANAVLSGFTITGGATKDVNSGETDGAGVWAEDVSAVVTNCVVSGNQAYYQGGGTLGCTVVNCTLSDNSSYAGGGAYGCELLGCTISGNTVVYSGGGVSECTASNCTITGNNAYEGGGAFHGTENNCTVNGNTAYQGGGAAFSTLNNSLLTGNSATYGGGAQSGALNNCTVVLNSGGGAAGSAMNNCILYFNDGGNYYDHFDVATLNHCCTTPMPGSGTGNITSDPSFVDVAHGNFHVHIFSPCIDAGDNSAVVGGTDLDGNARIVNGTVDIGAYEFHGSVHYVNINNLNPLPPYADWSTAATNIQDAINASTVGDLIQVTNGIYATGGETVNGFGLTNRVAINQPVTVQSVNGPSVTTIVGYQTPVTTNDATAIRCVYLTNGAALIGFTLSGGATLASGDGTSEQSGGGIWCEGTDALISNCTISSSAANNTGGGVHSGTLSNCAITGNWSRGNGGGLSSSVMIHCTISGNYSDNNGGGADSCTASNCQFSANTANPINDSIGGGAYNSLLWQCTLTGNAAFAGGGARSSTLDQCLIEGNSVSQPNCGGGGLEECVGRNCTITNNYSEDVGGGVDYSYLTNCIVINNRADGDGGGYWSGFGPNVAQNCLFTGNRAGGEGGGANEANLYNCTITGNSAAQGGGGISCSFYNCLVYENDAAYQPNHVYCYFEYTCTTPMPIPTENGPGNFSSDPQLADAFHLSAGSPCIGAGTPAYVSGLDLEGDAWANPPSVGCDEYHLAAGPINPTIQFDYTNVATGYPVSFTAQPGGNASGCVWNFGDGTRLTNQPFASHRWVAPGDYPVMLTVSNSTSPGGASSSITVHVVTPPIHYVALNSASPVAPFTSWNTAAADIQDAIDATTVPGAVVLVSNGVYQTGGRVVYGILTNRVAATRPVNLQSVNGAALTTIEGNSVLGDSAVRCVWLTNGSSLRGFTIASGGTRVNGNEPREIAAGGVWCQSSNVLVTDCTLTNNFASWDGGGMIGGTVSNCTFVANSSGDSGGGAAGGAYKNCLFIGNTAEAGGGVWTGTVNDSYLIGNTATLSGFGGGAYESVLNGSSLRNNNPAGANHSLINNCTLAGNTDGGAQSSVLNNSISFFNADENGAVDNYSSDSIVNYSCTTPLPSSGAGNIASNPQLSFDSVHLTASSPCIGAGNPAYATGVDIDGQPWANPPPIGCDEFGFSPVGPLSVSIQAAFTNIAPGFNDGFTIQLIGDASSIVWNFGDSTTVTNQSPLTHSWSSLGDYVVTLTAYNNDNPGGVSTSVTVNVVASNYYVAQANSNPVSPYTSWATAATNIEDAVALAPAGGTILVSNGVYRFGGGFADSTSNRVSAVVPLTIQSTGGPTVSVIDGGGALRCVYLASGSLLSGFTLTNGNAGPGNGGGVDCQTTTTVVTNCIIVNNHAQAGGGASSGTVNNCVLAGNVSNPNGSIFNAGGGANGSALNNCVLTNNSANFGGGAAHGTLVNCLLVGNLCVDGTFGAEGAGAGACALINCTIVGNSADPRNFGGGGGTYIGSETNCIIVNNSPDNANGGTQGNCCTGVTPSPLNVSDNFGADPKLDATYHLQSSSPCINAGKNSAVTTPFDLDGNPRIVGGTVDIGAYEYEAPTSIISYAWLEQYGLPTDGSVDHADLDGTSFNVYQDWIAGLDPTNASSVLIMLTPAPTNNPAGILVSWQSVAARTYYLQRATNLLAQPAFSSIQSNLAGQTGTTGYFDNTATNGGPYFYRVGVQ